MITMRIDDRMFRQDMDRFRSRSEQGFKRALLRAVLLLERNAKMRARDWTRSSKVRRGFLINGIIKKITHKGLTGEVISRASYSQAFEEGTRPHIIRVKNKKVLAGPKRGAPQGWIISKKSASMGYATYGKQISHPGTKPHPYMFPSWREACTAFENYMKEALR